ncbi:MAG: hypothetical protein U9R34_04125 [Nanoarchaeota archaeon]|nr:hypothetical protein [Nanoarchaeota archaeon]
MTQKILSEKIRANISHTKKIRNINERYQTAVTIEGIQHNYKLKRINEQYKLDLAVENRLYDNFKTYGNRSGENINK